MTMSYGVLIFLPSFFSYSKCLPTSHNVSSVSILLLLFAAWHRHIGTHYISGTVQQCVPLQSYHRPVNSWYNGTWYNGTWRRPSQDQSGDSESIGRSVSWEEPHSKNYLHHGGRSCTNVTVMKRFFLWILMFFSEKALVEEKKNVTCRLFLMKRVLSIWNGCVIPRT